MLSALLWPVLLFLIYALLCAIVVFLTWCFTRDTNRAEPMVDEPALDEHNASAHTRRIA